MGSRIRLLLALALSPSLWLAPLAPAHADPAAEMSSFSIFHPVDLARLEKGEIIAARGQPMNFPRGLCAESCYITPVPFAKAVAAHKAFNPSLHPELGVYLYIRTAGPRFNQLLLAPDNSEVRALAAATEKMRGLPHTSSGALSPEAVAYWSGLLSHRLTDFLAGGLPRLPPYADSIRPSEEAASLLKEQPKIRARFAPLTAFLNGGGNPSLSWNLFDVQGEAALSLSASFFRQNGASWQSMSVDYYASDGYYVYLSFIELWPTKNGTLAWRGDFLSSGTVGTLRGIARTIAGSFLVKGVRKNTVALLKDAEAAR